uniref:C2H2-type domain-containing protein n=2 Tax=Cyprinus carpio carpio TaxID=630221 RepID=A0A9J7ZTM9_CYPCA
MTFIKVESEDLKIEEAFRVKQEDTEEQTDLMALKVENEELKEIEEESQYERHIFMAVEKSIPTETNLFQDSESNSCHQCGKSFSLKGNHKEHMKIHTGEKLFTCQQCGKSFVKKGNLKDHMYIHTVVKPFTCDKCGMGFKYAESLSNHMRRIHSRDNCFICNQCGENFGSKVSLYSHVRLHTKEKQFICPLCGDTFLQNGNLKSHLRVHAAEKTFPSVWKAFQTENNP